MLLYVCRDSCINLGQTIFIYIFTDQNKYLYFMLRTPKEILMP